MAMARHSVGTRPQQPLAGQGDGADLRHLPSRQRRNELRARRRRWQQTGAFAHHDVPHDVLRSILGFLSAADVARCSVTCRAMRVVCCDGNMWRDYYVRDFRRTFPDAYRKEPCTVYSMYSVYSMYAARANRLRQRVHKAKTRRLRWRAKRQSALIQWHWVLACVPQSVLKPMQPHEALLAANAIRLTTVAVLAWVLWQVPLPVDSMSPTQAQYAQPWLSHAAEVGVLTYVCAGLAVGDGDSVFARVPRTLFNVGRQDRWTVWRGNAVVTLGLYLAWLLNSGCFPLHGVLGVLGTILFHMWWPIVQALCGTFFAIMLLEIAGDHPCRSLGVLLGGAVAFAATTAWLSVDGLHMTPSQGSWVLVPLLLVYTLLKHVFGSDVRRDDAAQTVFTALAAGVVHVLAQATPPWFWMATSTGIPVAVAARGLLHSLNLVVWTATAALWPLAAWWLVLPLCVARPSRNQATLGSRVACAATALAVLAAVLAVASYHMDVDTLRLAARWRDHTGSESSLAIRQDLTAMMRAMREREWSPPSQRDLERAFRQAFQSVGGHPDHPMNWTHDS